MNFRGIEVGGRFYRYHIGSANVVIRDENDRRTVVDFRVLTGLSGNEIERGKWKKTFSITPGQVAAYIQQVVPQAPLAAAGAATSAAALCS